MLAIGRCRAELQIETRPVGGDCRSTVGIAPAVNVDVIDEERPAIPVPAPPRRRLMATQPPGRFVLQYLPETRVGTGTREIRGVDIAGPQQIDSVMETGT